MSSNRLAADAVRNVTSTATVAPAAGAAPAQDTVGNALTALVRYVPTEVVTLYVATVAARQQIEAALPSFKALWLFWGFVCLTPLMFALLFYNKLAVANTKLRSWKEFPWWKMIASTIGFAVWALAVPNGPYLQTAGASALAGLAALFVSTVLSLLDPIFDRK